MQFTGLNNFHCSPNGRLQGCLVLNQNPGLYVGLPASVYICMYVCQGSR